jgi:ketosteroid isomerase-like protein
MATNEEQIRTLIGRWTAAIQRRDLDAVLADHADDIVMFDVPPPQQGVRGIDAYRESWPPFFQWLDSGAVFEIESLQVTAGDEVAFAYALLRCGIEKSFAENPDTRLRLPRKSTESRAPGRGPSPPTRGTLPGFRARRGSPLDIREGRAGIGECELSTDGRFASHERAETLASGRLADHRPALRRRHRRCCRSPARAGEAGQSLASACVQSRPRWEQANTPVEPG